MHLPVFAEIDGTKKHESADYQDDVKDKRQKYDMPRPVDESGQLQADEEHLQGTDEGYAMAGIAAVAQVTSNLRFLVTPLQGSEPNKPRMDNDGVTKDIISTI